MAFPLYIFIVSSQLLLLPFPLFLQPNYFRVCPPTPHTHPPLLHLCVCKTPRNLVFLSRGVGSQAPWSPRASCFWILLRDATRNKVPIDGGPPCSASQPLTPRDEFLSASPWLPSTLQPCSQETRAQQPRRTETDASQPAPPHRHPLKGNWARVLKTESEQRAHPNVTYACASGDTHREVC